jgi:hypothetical protein
MSNQTNCESCGALLNPGAPACESCGQPVSGAARPDVSAESWSQPSQSEPASAQQPSTDRWGSAQSGDTADDPGRWGSPQPAPPSSGSPPRPASATSSASEGFDVESAISSAGQTARKGVKWLVIGGVVLLLGCLCLVAALLLSGGALFSWLTTFGANGF